MAENICYFRYVMNWMLATHLERGLAYLMFELSSLSPSPRLSPYSFSSMMDMYLVRLTRMTSATIQCSTQRLAFCKPVAQKDHELASDNHSSTLLFCSPRLTIPSSVLKSLKTSHN
jgi:hypothetical protein